MKKYLFILVILSFSLSSFAQTIWTANVGNIEISGYYNIELDQRLIGAANSDFSDLRIIGSQGEKSSEVPYFTRPVSPIQEVSSFENYPLKENSAKDSLNLVIVDNVDKENLNRFYIAINNADVKIEISIRGSNDLKTWYIVKRKSNVSNYRNMQGNNAVLMVDFPQGDYRYYEIMLTNDQDSPLLVERVGKMSSTSIYGQFTEINTGKFVQTEKDNRTFITFPDLKYTYCISKIDFLVNTNMVYLRNAYIADSLHYDHASFQLSSKKNNEFFLDNFRMQSSTTIEVENNNNPPLHFDSVKFYALKRYICAYLEKGQKYTIEVNSKKYTYPNYDIQHFKNDIATDLPVISTTDVKSEQNEQKAVVREQMLIEKPVVLWSIIICIGLFLTFICVKMVKKMKEEEK